MSTFLPMLRLALVGLLGLGASPLAAQETAPASPACEPAILALEAVWNEAHLRGDVEALDRLWAADISVIVPEMRPFTKGELLELWRSTKVTFTRYATSDLNVRCSGDAAVVTGRLRRSRDFGGRARSEDWLFTKSYARTDGEWRVVAYHASTSPEP